MPSIAAILNDETRLIYGRVMVLILLLKFWLRGPATPESFFCLVQSSDAERSEIELLSYQVPEANIGIGCWRGWKLIFDVADVLPAASVTVAVKLNVSNPEKAPTFAV